MTVRLRNSAKAVVLDGGRLLVTRNRTAEDPAGDWLLLPGGGQKPGETLVEALQREVLEETGFTIEPGPLLWIREYIGSHHEFARHDAGEHQIEFMFRCRITGEGRAPTEQDTHQVGVEWMDVDLLAGRRLYPAAIADPIRRLAAGEDSGPVYLGDVN